MLGSLGCLKTKLDLESSISAFSTEYQKHNHRLVCKSRRDWKTQLEKTKYESMIWYQIIIVFQIWLLVQMMYIRMALDSEFVPYLLQFVVLAFFLSWLQCPVHKFSISAKENCIGKQLQGSYSFSFVMKTVYISQRLVASIPGAELITIFLISGWTVHKEKYKEGLYISDIESPTSYNGVYCLTKIFGTFWRCFRKIFRNIMLYVNWLKTL